MKNLWLTLLLLGILVVTRAGDCFGEDCAFSLEGDKQEEEPSIADVVPEVNKQIRRSYWYYLRKANLLFQANVETQVRYIHFFIYRNRVGTFLVIASWDRKERVAEVNTFVRLGNGYQKDVTTSLYDPVSINPFIISLRLSFGEFLIELDEDGNFLLDGKMITTEEEEKSIDKIDIDEKTKILDEHIRKTYWYYLLEAALVHTQSIQTTKRLYVVLTYVNIVGTFLVIASCDAADVIQVNTFVRLGRGSDSKKIEPIALKPAVFELEGY